MAAIHQETVSNLLDRGIETAGDSERESRVRELSPHLMTRAEVLFAMEGICPGGATTVLAPESARYYDALEARLKMLNYHPELEDMARADRNGFLSVVR